MDQSVAEFVGPNNHSDKLLRYILKIIIVWDVLNLSTHLWTLTPMKHPKNDLKFKKEFAVEHTIYKGNMEKSAHLLTFALNGDYAEIRIVLDYA